MQTIKIQFTDFWGDFNPTDNFIVRALKRHYNVELSEQPDYLFYATFGINHLRYNCVRIMFTGENLVPDFNVADYGMGFDHLQFGDRYLRLPLYLLRNNFPLLQHPQPLSDAEALGRKFCSIVCSNARWASPHRERFFRLLSQYKQVDSGGALWNNVGGRVPDKQAFLSQYKFNIAFENSSTWGYTTEKILDAYTANSVPIYWGNPVVERDFNRESFVNISDYRTMEEAVERIVALDNDDDAYLKMLHAVKPADEGMFDWEDRLADFLQAIVEKPLDKARYTDGYGMVQLHIRDMRCARLFGQKLRLYKAMAAYQKLRNKLHRG